MRGAFALAKLVLGFLLVWLPAIAADQCCDLSGSFCRYYDPATQSCCDGNVVVGDSCCCVDDNDIQGCMRYQGYDSSKQTCCGNAVMDGNSCCCVDDNDIQGCMRYQGYDSSKQTCCGSAVMDGNSCCCVDDNDIQGCMRYQGYDSSKQTCCGSAVMDGNSCCCVDDNDIQGCMRYQGYDTHRKLQPSGDYVPQVCCKNEVLEGNACCCLNDAGFGSCLNYQGFDTSWQKCVENHIQNTGRKPSPPPPPPPPYTGPMCMDGTWPSFSNQSALANNAGWSTYFKNLYGTLPDGPWPLCIGSFWAFWTDKLAASKAWMPKSNGRCPSKDAPTGQRYDLNNFYSSNLLTWSWHPISDPAFRGFPSNTLVEISHEQDPFGDEHYGMWFVYAKGTGIYFDLGNTVIFKLHSEAFNYFGAGSNEEMCRKAAAQGVDSIQFTAHVDHTNYPCDSAVGAPYMNIEIVATALTGTYSCGQKTGTPKSLRQGWGGTLPCNCDNSLPQTNCVLPIEESKLSVNISVE